MPGFRCRTARQTGSLRFTKRGISGRGPTRLISPLITFHIWGSSSILYLRSILPTRIIAGGNAAAGHACAHGAELPDTKQPAAAADTLVPEKYRPPIFQNYRDSDQDQ